MIRSIEENGIIINEPRDDSGIQIVLSIKKAFKLPYANTCDSVQGISIYDKITCFDCSTPYVDRCIIWTVITRATDLKKRTNFRTLGGRNHDTKKIMGKIIFQSKSSGI